MPEESQPPEKEETGTTRFIRFKPDKEAGELVVDSYRQIQDGAVREIDPPEGEAPIGTPISKIPKLNS